MSFFGLREQGIDNELPSPDRNSFTITPQPIVMVAPSHINSTQREPNMGSIPSVLQKQPTVQVPTQPYEQYISINDNTTQLNKYQTHQKNDPIYNNQRKSITQATFQQPIVQSSINERESIGRVVHQQPEIQKGDPIHINERKSISQATVQQPVAQKSLDERVNITRVSYQQPLIEKSHPIYNAERKSIVQTTLHTQPILVQSHPQPTLSVIQTHKPLEIKEPNLKEQKIPTFSQIRTSNFHKESRREPITINRSVLAPISTHTNQLELRDQAYKLDNNASMNLGRRVTEQKVEPTPDQSKLAEENLKLTVKKETPLLRASTPNLLSSLASNQPPKSQHRYSNSYTTTDPVESRVVSHNTTTVFVHKGRVDGGPDSMESSVRHTTASSSNIRSSYHNHESRESIKSLVRTSSNPAITRPSQTAGQPRQAIQFNNHALFQKKSTAPMFSNFKR